VYTKVKLLVASKSIAIVTPSFYPMIGGIESYTRGIGSQLVRLGFDVHVYTPDSVLKKKLEPKEEVIDGMYIHRLPVAIDLSYRLRLWPNLYKALLSMKHDIIHVYSHDLYSLSALFAARNTSTPFIITTYGPFTTHADYGSLKLAMFGIYDGLVTPALFRGSELVFVRYPELVKWVRSFGIEDDKVEVEPSGMPSSYLVPGDKEGFTKKFGHGPFILYIGRISPQKGLQHLILSMKAILSFSRNVRLLLVGPDYTGYSNYLVRLASSIGVLDNVLFHEPVTDEEQERDILASCDLLVMPSSFEGFSQAVLKAMAQGKPVVVTDVGGLPFEVGYGSCGMITRFADHNGMAEAIIRLLQDEKLRRKMGEAGKERALLFTFENLAKKIASEYVKVMN
jgi:glycosyltransferase involved in cell wall biosynthesis